MPNINEIKDAFSKYIVSPASRFGLGGFVFDIENDTDVSLTSLITDNYVEDNTAVQDHIALAPLRVTLKSDVGELLFNPEEDSFNNFQKVIQKLTTIEAFLPSLSDEEQQFRDNTTEEDFIDINSDTYDDLLNLWDLTVNLNPGATRQQKAYLYFKSLWKKRILVAVLTPFGFMKSMAIESIDAKQSSDSKFISNFSITLKEFRTTSLTTIEFDEENFQNRSKQQSQPEFNNGSTNGKSILLQTLEDTFEGFSPTGTLP